MFKNQSADSGGVAKRSPQQGGELPEERTAEQAAALRERRAAAAPHQGGTEGVPAGEEQGWDRVLGHVPVKLPETIWALL